jgi:osmotically-inducible protein OsmY
VDNYLSVNAEQPPKSDLAICSDVESQLYWDAAVNGGDIQVSVDGGIVTLIGNVDTWYEYTQAAQDAYDGGATGLRNELHVRSTPDADSKNS